MIEVLNKLIGGSNNCINFKLKLDNFNNLINLIFIFIMYQLILKLIYNLYLKNKKNIDNLSWQNIFYIKYKYIWIDILIVLLLELFFQIIFNTTYINKLKLIIITSYLVYKIIQNQDKLIDQIHIIIDKFKKLKDKL